MNDIEQNALFQQSDKGLLKAKVRRVEVAMATRVKRASDLTWDQSINLGIVLFLIKTSLTTQKLISENKETAGAGRENRSAATRCKDGKLARKLTTD